MVLGLMGLLTVALFRTGASGWKKLEAQSTMLADYEVLQAKLSREAQRSTFVSASTETDADGTTLAFLSAVDDSGEFVLDNGTFNPLWQKYLVFYYESSTRNVYLSEVPLAPGSPESTSPEPLEFYDAGSGKLKDYRTGGRLLMTDVDVCNFTLDNTMLITEIEGSRLRYGDSEPEELKMITSVAFRN